MRTTRMLLRRVLVEMSRPRSDFAGASSEHLCGGKLWNILSNETELPYGTARDVLNVPGG